MCCMLFLKNLNALFVTNFQHFSKTFFWSFDVVSVRAIALEIVNLWCLNLGKKLWIKTQSWFIDSCTACLRNWFIVFKVSSKLFIKPPAKSKVSKLLEAGKRNLPHGKRSSLEYQGFYFKSHFVEHLYVRYVSVFTWDQISYVDGNTPFVVRGNISDVISTLEEIDEKPLIWFSYNQMKLNTSSYNQIKLNIFRTF